MNNIPINFKYKADNINDFNLNQHDKDLLTIYINIDNLNLIIYGNIGTGKTSLANYIISEYYNYPSLDNNTINSIQNNNILYINLLKDQGINYYRTDVKNFCTSLSIVKNKKKFVIIDHIDILSEQNQYTFRNYIDNYSSNVNFLITCLELNKIYESIRNKLDIIKLNNIDNIFLKKIYNKISIKENIYLDIKDVENIINVSNNSISCMINNIQKIILTDKKINNIYDITHNISKNLLDKYILACKQNDLCEAYGILNNLYNTGITVIDILDNLTHYINYHTNNILKTEEKYKMLIIICKFINIFYNIHEDNIELLFMTNNICKLLHKI
tara:strand:- start:111 stop:1097 length:987 start_codon:yes stop_codon:yes gene_type:complete